MVTVQQLGRPPYNERVIEGLRQLPRPLYHPDPDLESFAALRAAGLDVEPLPDELTTGTLLVLPATGPLERLVGIVDRLLGPGGCPWDQAQTHATLKKYLIEEAYELCEAIDADDKPAMREELGDVLLQPLLHAAMLKRDELFDIDAVADGISDKLVRRHPHVFGDVDAADVEQVLKNWDAIKKSEKADAPKSVLAGVPKALPALLRANEISKRAARQGFEWPNLDGVWEKFDEETAELREAISSGDREAISGELGDLLFTVVNLARWLKIEPEEALSRMLTRFQTRFETMESLASGPLNELSPDAWESLWQRAKKTSEIV